MKLNTYYRIKDGIYCYAASSQSVFLVWSVNNEPLPVTIKLLAWSLGMEIGYLVIKYPNSTQSDLEGLILSNVGGGTL